MSEVKTNRPTHRWAEKYPFLGDDPVPTRQCYDPAHFAQERDKIFTKVWWQVAQVNEIPKPRDYKVRQLGFANASVAIVRGDDGKIRAFYNTCSHRGNKPIKETGWDTYGQARANAITCRFHGWVYNGRGELMFVPEEEKFFKLDKKSCGLTPIACEEWNGFIFVNLDPKPSQTLREYLGTMGDYLSGFPYPELTYVYRYQTLLKANWKICADAFQEAYHAATIHAGTFPDIFYTSVENVQIAGPHRTSAVCLNLATMKITPIAALTAEISENSITQQREKKMLPPHLNPDNRADYAFEMPVFFPFFMVALGEGVVFTHNYYPIDENHTLWEGAQYVKSPTSWAERFAAEHGQVLQRDAWLEDTETMEDTHAAVQSGSKEFFRLQDEEVLPRHGYHAVKRYLAKNGSFKGGFGWGDFE